LAKFVGIAEETTYGTPVTASEWIDINSESVNPDHAWIDVETAGSRALMNRIPGPYRVSGDIVYVVNPDNITKMLKWLCGSVTTSDDGGSPAVAYKHEFTAPSSSIKSFTLEISPDVGNQSRQIAGCAVRSLAFDAPEARGIVSVTATILGQKETLITPSTPTFSTLRPFAFFDGSLKVAGSEIADAEAFSITLENDIPDDVHVLGSRFLPGIRLQGFTVTGSMDVAFTSWDLYKRFFGSATATGPQVIPETVSIELTLTGDETGSSVTGFENYQLKIEIPKATLDSSEANIDSRSRIVQSLGFTGLYDPTSGYAAKITVVNKNSEP